MPQPRVDSAVVRLVPRGDHPTGGLWEATVRIVDAAFAQRRKTIRNSLAAGLSVDSEPVEELLVSCGLDPGVRAERLPPADFVELASKALENSLLP